MAKKEKVLCIKRSALPKEWLKKRCASKIDESIFYTLCAQSGFSWMDRNQVETQPWYKQIIPYIVIQTADLLQTAVYRRQGSETRLHDLWSLGIGGHINPVDNDDVNKSLDKRAERNESRSFAPHEFSPKKFNDSAEQFKNIIYSGMMRELDEELFNLPGEISPLFYGLINEEETAVGQVHLGVVFRILTDCPERFEPGEELSGFKWESTASLDTLNMEDWSSLALELFKK